MCLVAECCARRQARLGYLQKRQETKVDARMDKTSGSMVHGDISRNLIVVRYRGRVAAAEVKAVSEKVMDLLPQMRQGFTFLADLSCLESMELDCMADITKIMDACNSTGIGTVVRIVPDPRKDIGLNILSIIHYRRGVHVITCQNSEEAERVI